MKFNLSHPVAYVIEGLLVCAVVGKDYAHCTLVVGLSDSAETLLPCCVPDLQFHILAIDLYGLDLEVNTYKELVRDVCKNRWSIFRVGFNETGRLIILTDG
jgi:hypothetical protein